MNKTPTNMLDDETIDPQVIKMVDKWLNILIDRGYDELTAVRLLKVCLYKKQKEYRRKHLTIVK